MHIKNINIKKAKKSYKNFKFKIKFRSLINKKALEFSNKLDKKQINEAKNENIRPKRYLFKSHFVTETGFVCKNEISFLVSDFIIGERKNKIKPKHKKKNIKGEADSRLFKKSKELVKP